ncbi:MAG TPA: M55 family metallopeptidase [Vicinamibacterales bacterium]|nr:M55 family metallopeptidase [Vicinamibacterales bacterium]
MNTLLWVALIVVAASSGLSGQQARPLKVFISVDMEGLSGVVSGNEVSPTGPDYAHFRKIMAMETNAAVEGAFRAGATDVLVRDSHGSKQNLLPADVDKRARLLRGQSTGPKNMMEGIDESFGAVVFIGFHAKAGTPNAILEHTSTGNVIDFSINDVSLPEAGYNALVAGLYDVPVVFIAGDKAVVDQVRGLVGPIEAVAVKEDIRDASLGMSPAQAEILIQQGVEKAVRNRAQAKPYTMPGPYRMTLKVTAEKPPYPGVTRVRQGEYTYTSPDLLEILKAFNALK